MEGVWANIGEDLVRDVCGVNVEYVAANDVVGGDAEGCGLGGEGLGVPEAGRVGYERNGGADEGEDEGWAWEEAFFLQVGDLFEE